MLGAELYDRTNVVGEQVALSRNLAWACRTVAIWALRNNEVVRVAAIAFKLALDADVLREIIRNSTPAPVQGEGRNDLVVLWIGVDVGIIERNLNLWWGVLRERHRSKQQNYPENYCTSAFHVDLLQNLVASHVSLRTKMLRARNRPTGRTLRPFHGPSDC